MYSSGFTYESCDLVYGLETTDRSPKYFLKFATHSRSLQARIQFDPQIPGFRVLANVFYLAEGHELKVTRFFTVFSLLNSSKS